MQLIFAVYHSKMASSLKIWVQNADRAGSTRRRDNASSSAMSDAGSVSSEPSKHGFKQFCYEYTHMINLKAIVLFLTLLLMHISLSRNTPEDISEAPITGVSINKNRLVPCSNKHIVVLNFYCFHMFFGLQFPHA